MNLGVVEHVYNPSTQEFGGRETRSQRPDLVKQEVQVRSQNQPTNQTARAKQAVVIYAILRPNQDYNTTHSSRPTEASFGSKLLWIIEFLVNQGIRLNV